ncbi:MAG: prolyl oligopeptidase family serine peptidase [Acidobacteriota bacterium]|nr:prolyl oligopeptidase family serine peptidase [Acidobacteriota bacterium]
MKIERREFFELAGLAVAGAAFFNAPPVKAQRPLPKSEYDYVDWSWEKWREITKAARPRIVGEQSGKAELYDLLELGKEKIKTPNEWRARRAEIKNRLNVFLGEPPKRKPPLNVKIIEETQRENHILRKLVYQTESGEFVPAYLLIPKNLKGRAPVVLCPHQTTQAGKKEPAGLAGNPQLQTALHLARRGFVTFTYDALCFGERHDATSGHYGDAIPFYQKHPSWSLMGKMIWDLQRAIDYLETLDFVDRKRIGSIGHSHGGYTTLFAMAFDERITAGASNCGFDTFRVDGNTFRWSKATALMPLLGFYVSNPRINMDFYRAVPDSSVADVPFEMHELLALIAPRPLLLSTSDEDFVFPNGGWSVRRALARIKPVYELLDAPENLSSYFFDGGHNFTAEASSNAYAWLERRLKS